MEFIKVCDDGTDQVIVFIHGFRCEYLPFKLKGRTVRHALNYTNYLKAAKLKGKVFLGKWPSQGLKVPPFVSLLRRLNFSPLFLLEYVLMKAVDFKSAEKQAKKEGDSLLANLMGEFSGSPNTKIYLLGHSLGALVIHHSLTACSNFWKCRKAEIKLEDVVYMGSAVPIYESVESPQMYWNALLNSINGNFFNLYSKRDKVLLAPPDLKSRLGRKRLDHSSQRIIDVHCKRFGHFHYPKRLRRVIRKFPLRDQSSLDLGLTK